jgi:hypothetical protein
MGPHASAASRTLCGATGMDDDIGKGELEMKRAWRGRRMRQALKLDRQLGGGGVLPILPSGTGRRSAPLRWFCYMHIALICQSRLLQRSSAFLAWLGPGTGFDFNKWRANAFRLFRFAEFEHAFDHKLVSFSACTKCCMHLSQSCHRLRTSSYLPPDGEQTRRSGPGWCCRELSAIAGKN